MLGCKYEREANDSAHALLMDGWEAMEAGLVNPWEVAEHFRVSDEIVRLQAPLELDSRDDRSCNRPHAPSGL